MDYMGFKIETDPKVPENIIGFSNGKTAGFVDLDTGDTTTFTVESGGIFITTIKGPDHHGIAIASKDLVGKLLEPKIVIDIE